jgi:hypothetical protein
MDDFNNFEKFTLAIATAVYHFHRKASNVSEYSFKDVCVALNTGSFTRSSSFTLSESDLEAAFENSTIRKSLKAIFPNQVIFQRRSIRVGTEIVNYHKIRFLSLNIGLHTVESLRDAIMNQLPRAAQVNNGDEKEDEKLTVIYNT